MRQIKVRRYPWGEAVSLEAAAAQGSVDFSGCLILEMPAAQIKLLHNLDYKVIGIEYSSAGEDYKLVVLPYAVENAGSGSLLNYSIAASAGKALQLRVANLHALTEDYLESEKENLKNWSGFFEVLAHCEEKTLSGELQLRHYADLPRIIAAISSDADVYKPLIVKICEELRRFIPYVMQGMRKTLKREDRLLKLELVNEINISSMRWLVRQPGKTLEQKAAANDFQIMAVSRRENYDLLENRVLKDFLLRCEKACRAYLDERQTSENDQIKHFMHLCADSCQRPEMQNVRRQRVLPVPNYVLQHDVRYRKIWRFYVELLRQQHRIDELFRWQYITCGDVTALLTAGALYALAENGPDHFTLTEIAGADISILAAHKQGSLLDYSCPPGSFILSDAYDNSYVVDFIADSGEEYSWGSEGFYDEAAAAASRLGARSYLLLTPLKEQQRPVLIFLYSLNLNLQEQVLDLAGIAQSAEKHLLKFEKSWANSYGYGFRFFALVVCCDSRKLTAANIISVQKKVSCLNLQMQLSGWKSCLEALQFNLVQVISQVIAHG